ncbi:caspase recruitment domain-containing protein 6 isoform X2 [Molossus molossus]|uniref:caspase recruitment domain-containing protein 6 isoform X2 n=1 Tax=Molossus molossus TaxID=27622 RepID=UPI0017466A30|nr:caspase recruitment domain-containing protein 6 isoform X2 [Molossus molossus]
MATGSRPSEVIERERKKLLEILQQDLDSILDSLTSRRLISEDEYETLEGIPDPLKKSRKLLILVQKKGEDSCQHFLKCLFSTFPESETIWGLRHEFLRHENIEPPPSTAVSKSPEGLFSPAEKQPENSEITVCFEETEHADLETSEMCMDKKTSHREKAWSPREDEKEHGTPAVPMPRSVESADYDVSETTDYLQDGQRYDEPDDSLYLGQEDYLELVVYSEDEGSPAEEEEDDDPEDLVYDGEEDPAYSETTEFSGEEQSYDDSETGMSLEEKEEKSMEERKKVFQDVLSCLNLDRSRKLLPDSVKQFSLDRGCEWTPATPGDLAWNFLVKIQALDVTAGDSSLRHEVLCEDSKGDLPSGAENLETRDIPTVHPLDVLCASLLCADSSLQHLVMSGLHRCRSALPLLLPDAENSRAILLLGAMQDLVKEQPAQPSGGPAGEAGRSLALMKTPVISFVRLGDCSFSKSRILNTLLSPAGSKPHQIFLHQDRPVPAPPRRISDGLVQVAWCFPAGHSPEADPCVFQEPVAVANLRGDLESFWTQFGFLMEVSSAVFFFTDCLGEREWDLLMFLGEAAIERCYFVLGPQARESEEAQIFQTILKLKPSQLLFWEEEGAEEKGRNMKGLCAALKEVMSLSLRRVSVEDMASLARELGIQVDQDFKDIEGIQVSPGEDVAGAVEGEGQQRHRQPEGPSAGPAGEPGREPGREPAAAGQIRQDVHLPPGPRPSVQNPGPFPVGLGDHLNRVPWEAPWMMHFHFGSEQKSKWFCPPPFQKSGVRRQGKSCGVQYFQPQRFCSGERFMKFSRPARGRHGDGLLGSPPKPFCQRAQAWPGRWQTRAACETPATVVSQLVHFHSQPSGPAGKPQPRQGQAQGAPPPKATGKPVRTTPHTVNPHSGAFQPAGVMQRPPRPPFQQGFKPKIQGGPLNPAGLMGPHPMSNNRFVPSSPFIQPKPFQGKHPQPKPSQPGPSQPKPMQTKPTQPQPSPARGSPSKPTQAQPPQPCPPQSLQSRPAQPRPPQPQSSQTRRSQAKASYSRAGPRRGGKH